jgi:hypothetical protein
MITSVGVEKLFSKRLDQMICTVLHNKLQRYQGPVNFNLHAGELAVWGMPNVLLKQQTTTTVGLLNSAPDLPTPSTYVRRFGSMRRAYELIGYDRPSQFGSIDVRARIHALREQLLAQITRLFPGDVQIVRRGGRWRSRLRTRNGRVVSVLIARAVRVWKETVSWHVDPVPHEC